MQEKISKHPEYRHDMTGVDFSNFRVLLVYANSPMDNLFPVGLSSIAGMLKKHNIDFDYTFINKNCTRNNILFPDVPMYDTLSLARTFIYFYSSFSLTSLCAYYDISIGQAHRAGADAFATGILFKFLIQEALSRPLNLIQKIDIIIKDSNLIYNSKLFSKSVKRLLKSLFN